MDNGIHVGWTVALTKECKVSKPVLIEPEMDMLKEEGCKGRGWST
jgi:hypothetical protein